MTQIVHIESGAVRLVGDALKTAGARSVFLVTGNSSFSTCGAEAALQPLNQEYKIRRFSGFPANPTLSSVAEGLAAFRSGSFDALVAVGGGSVIDTAKLIATLSAQDGEPERFLVGRQSIRRQGPPLIAVPTTAGSGSEATHFATVFVEGRKHSVSHVSMLPSVAIVDPDLTTTAPSRLTATCGFDAFSQAMESFWSVRSTDESRQLAEQAVRLVLRHLENAVCRPSPDSRYGMCQASHLAGQAINITTTTVPHAMSYFMTSQFGIPHGHAVGLTLGEVLVFNSEVSDGDVVDPRGVEFVRNAIRQLNRMLGTCDAIASRDMINRFMERLGLETRLGQLGISVGTAQRAMDDKVNSERLRNNPRSFAKAQLYELLSAIA